jgi:hypothetical protein
MFYPTDNEHVGEQLAYYRQREWRLLDAQLAVQGHPICRALTPGEVAELQSIDERFWRTTLVSDGVTQSRADWALIYQPTPGWSLLNLADCIYAPKAGMARVTEIVGASIPVREYPQAA